MAVKLGYYQCVEVEKVDNLVLPSAAYHLTAALPEECAEATLSSIAALTD